jgi:hypothetical protein
MSSHTSQPAAEDGPDPSLAPIVERCAGAGPDDVWRLAIAWQDPHERAELVRAALGVAEQDGRTRAVRAAAAATARLLRESEGGRAVVHRLPGVVFRAEAAVQEAALAALLADGLSPEVRDALAAPWEWAFAGPPAPGAGDETPPA